MGNSRAFVRINGGTKYFSDKKKYAYRINTSLGYDNSNYRDADSNFFVGMSVYRSAIKISRITSLSTSFNVGFGSHTEGYNQATLGSSIRYNVSMGRNRLLGITYKTGQNSSRNNTYATQYLSLSYSHNRYKLWNMSLTTSYNLRASRIGTVSTRFGYEFSNKLDLQTNLIYDVRQSRFNMKTYQVAYDLMGSMLNSYWNVETNDFIIDINTQF